MRHDMFKVIVENPRAGVEYFRTQRNNYRKAKTFVLDEDGYVDDAFTSNQLSMRGRKFGLDHKNLNENLAPLYRYLEKSVGKKWDDVYSDISKNLDSRSTVKQHVRDHLNDFVCIHTFRDAGGNLFGSSQYGNIYEEWHFSFYVENGILCKAKKKPWKKDYRARVEAQQAEQLCTFVKITENSSFEKIDGLWFYIETGIVVDIFGISNPVVTVKKSLSRKEIKKHNLN